MNKTKAVKVNLDPVDVKEERLSGKEINLLSDTGLAVFQTEIKKRIIKISSLLLVVMVIISGGVFYYNYEVNRQRQALYSQRTVLQEQVKLLEQQLKTLGSAQQRLGRVKKLLGEKSSQQGLGALEQEIVVLAQEVGANIVSLGWKENTLSARLKLGNISNVHWLLEKLKQKESAGGWSGIKVADLGRQQDTFYAVEFMAGIKKIEPSGQLSN